MVHFFRSSKPLTICCMGLAILSQSLPRDADGEERRSKEKTQIQCFFETIDAGKLDLVKEFIDAGIDVDSRDSDKWTPLHRATARKNGEIVRLLIHAGANVNAEHYLRGTPLHLAATYCSVEVVRDLLKAGADVNSEASSDGETALHCAADRCRADIVKLLIDAGAIVDSGSMTPLTSACRQAKGDQTAAIKVLLDAGADVNPIGDTPLHWTRSPAVTKLLIAAGADVNRRNESVQSPLHLSAAPHWGPREEEFKLMIAAGADINARDTDDSTPLHEAAVKNLPGVAQLLIIAGANVNAIDSFGGTPLSNAKRSKADGIIEMLTAAGANDGLTSLGRAAAQGDLNRVNELIASGVDVNETGSEKKTALHLACENDQLEVLRALITAKADVNCRAAGDLVPLHLTTTKDAAQALLDAGASKEPNPASALGTPLFLAATSGRSEIVKLLLENDNNPVPKDLVVWVTFYGRVDVLQLLLSRGGNPNESVFRFGIGPNALLVATSGAVADVQSPENVTPEVRLQMATLLIKAGSDVNTRSSSGFFENYSAVHAAAEKGEIELIKLLIEHKADARASGAGKYFDGVTPLHLAAKGGHILAAEALVKAGAEVNARIGMTKLDALKTPLDCCKSKKLQAVLIEHGGKTSAEIDK